MIRFVKVAALAAGITLTGAAPAAADVTLINVFEVPAGKEDAVIAAWEKARDFLRQEPGYVSTALHQAIAPDARFALINVAVWESAEAFRQATARMQAAGVLPEIEGLRFTPALYRVIRSDEPQQ
jgi:quinol monooxygenase YgiN